MFITIQLNLTNSLLQEESDKLQPLSKIKQTSEVLRKVEEKRMSVIGPTGWMDQLPTCFQEGDLKLDCNKNNYSNSVRTLMYQSLYHLSLNSTLFFSPRIREVR